MGYNKRSDDRPGLSATATAAIAVNPASFHTGMALTPLTLAQEANSVMKAVNTSGGCPLSTEQGQKGKKKTAAEESLAASNASFNPEMAQMIGLSSNHQQQQWMQQQAMMMTMMMANPAFQAMQLALHNNTMNARSTGSSRDTDGGAASSTIGASVDPTCNSRSSAEGIMDGVTDSRARSNSSSAPRTGTSNDDDDDEDDDDDATNVNAGAATCKKGLI